MIRAQIKLFFILFLFVAAPAMYANAVIFSDDATIENTYLLYKTTLGNAGISYTNRFIFPLYTSQTIALSCENSLI